VRLAANTAHLDIQYAVGMDLDKNFQFDSVGGN